MEVGLIALALRFRLQVSSCGVIEGLKLSWLLQVDDLSQNGMTGCDRSSRVMLRIGRQAVQSHKRRGAGGMRTGWRLCAERRETSRSKEYTSTPPMLAADNVRNSRRRMMGESLSWPGLELKEHL